MKNILCSKRRLLLAFLIAPIAAGMVTLLWGSMLILFGRELSGDEIYYAAFQGSYAELKWKRFQDVLVFSMIAPIFAALPVTVAGGIGLFVFKPQGMTALRHALQLATALVVIPEVVALAEVEVFILWWGLLCAWSCAVVFWYLGVKDNVVISGSAEKLA